MSQVKPIYRRPRAHRVPTLVADELRRQGKRQGLLEVKALPWWRRLRIAWRIARGSTSAAAQLAEERSMQRTIETPTRYTVQHHEPPA